MNLVRIGGLIAGAGDIIAVALTMVRHARETADPKSAYPASLSGQRKMQVQRPEDRQSHAAIDMSRSHALPGGIDWLALAAEELGPQLVALRDQADFLRRQIAYAPLSRSPRGWRIMRRIRKIWSKPVGECVHCRCGKGIPTAHFS
jgi:hypothetical protein